MGLKVERKVEKVNGKELSYHQFVEKYLVQNQPVILTGLMDDWRACKDWVFENGKPNLEYFSTHFGKSKVQVADCGIREFTDQKRLEMSVSEFIEKWVQLCYSREITNEEFDGMSLLYLKDWHFVKAIWWECTQEQNEIIFVPSGWYHQVHNLEDTISINHNWFNAYNVCWVWDLLLKDYKEARNLIEDIKEICDDFEGLCQRNLAANTGMNCRDFLVFMVRFAFANLFQLHHLARCDKDSRCWSSQISRHLVFNIQSIRNIALKMNSFGVCTDHGMLIHPKKILEDHSFMELCTTLKETYGMIYGPCEISYDEKMTLSSDTDAMFCNFFRPCICSSEDLVWLIDFTFRKLGLVAGENLPSGETRCNPEE